MKKSLSICKKMQTLTTNKRSLLWIIALNAALAFSSIIVDWPWLMSVPPLLRPFAPICSLYPLLLTIWFTLTYFHKKIPTWFTAFIFMGIVSYGVMSWIYFPLYMSWKGINIHDVGSIFWVSLYAVQAIILAPHLKKMPYFHYALIFGYFLFKDYSDRYLGTFLDILLDSYPENFKLIFSVSVVVLHFAAATLVLYLSRHLRLIQSAPTDPIFQCKNDPPEQRAAL